MQRQLSALEISGICGRAIDLQKNDLQFVLFYDLNQQVLGRNGFAPAAEVARMRLRQATLARQAEQRAQRLAAQPDLVKQIKGLTTRLQAAADQGNFGAVFAAVRDLLAIREHHVVDDYIVQTYGLSQQQFLQNGLTRGQNLMRERRQKKQRVRCSV